MTPRELLELAEDVKAMVAGPAVRAMHARFGPVFDVVRARSADGIRAQTGVLLALGTPEDEWTEAVLLRLLRCLRAEAESLRRDGYGAADPLEVLPWDAPPSVRMALMADEVMSP